MVRDANGKTDAEAQRESLDPLELLGYEGGEGDSPTGVLREILADLAEREREEFGREVVRPGKPEESLSSGEALAVAHVRHGFLRAAEALRGDTDDESTDESGHSADEGAEDGEAYLGESERPMFY